jgi:hypothetical protein
MATVHSDQYQAAYVSVPSVALDANESGGRVRVKRATLNTTAKPVNSGDIINLLKLPPGACILGGDVKFGAMGASATLAIGVAGTPGKYLGATSVAAAGKALLADSLALGGSEELTVETTLIGTAAGANYAAGQDLKVTIQYAVD